MVVGPPFRADWNQKQKSEAKSGVDFSKNSDGEIRENPCRNLMQIDAGILQKLAARAVCETQTTFLFPSCVFC